ncbi:MAG: threonine--tRNA ligase [Patescibacteria group bacterium]|nr:threonine--tRNA ligase [Patescibacteria group bacterium]
MASEKVNLEATRHSASHVMAAAVGELFQNVKYGIGPTIENGFYYDFDLARQLTPEDLPKIEEKMRLIIKQDLPINCKELSVEDALRLVKELKQPFKEELILDLKEKGEKTITFYTIGDFTDLCRGPHVDRTGQIGPFKLLSLAGAYWKGSEENPMLQRIYGTAWSTKEEMINYLKQLEEAKARDHRKIGKDLGLFVFSDLVGKGLPLLTAKGATIKRELERFVVDEEIKRGYQHVHTPPLAKVDLYRTSGHYPYYKDTMYPPMKVDEEELILRPMTCPHHFMLYKSEPRSYKDLPIRIAEIASQFRYEKSGELTGLMRVRMFCLADAHIICTPEQVKSVIKEALDLIDYINSVLGLTKGQDYRYRLSLGDRADAKKYYKDDKAWDKAEQTLREVLTETKAPFYEASGEAAFYGPKIDVQVKNVLGKEETAFTVQYDFVMPQRFNLTYVDRDGKEKQPIVIHRSSIGAFERTMAFLIEKYGGAFPTWLAPVQVAIIPISDKQLKYAQKVAEEISSSFAEENLSVRQEIYGQNETMQEKIRQAQLQKIPYMLVVGGREEEAGTVAVRARNGENLGVMKVAEFSARVEKEIIDKK